MMVLATAILQSEVALILLDNDGNTKEVVLLLLATYGADFMSWVLHNSSSWDLIPTKLL
jgi:hypothetical protein